MVNYVYGARGVVRNVCLSLRNLWPIKVVLLEWNLEWRVKDDQIKKENTLGWWASSEVHLVSRSDAGKLLSVRPGFGQRSECLKMRAGKSSMPGLALQWTALPVWAPLLSSLPLLTTFVFLPSMTQICQFLTCLGSVHTLLQSEIFSLTLCRAGPILSTQSQLSVTYLVDRPWSHCLLLLKRLSGQMWRNRTLVTCKPKAQKPACHLLLWSVVWEWFVHVQWLKVNFKTYYLVTWES